MSYTRLDKATGPECPDCGCAASRVVASRPGRTGSAIRGTLALWTIERRRCDECGCEFSNRLERADEGETEQAEQSGVVYEPLRCPRCSSKKVPVMSTRAVGGATQRHHRCRDCGCRFKSIETVDEDERPPSRLRR